MTQLDCMIRLAWLRDRPDLLTPEQRELVEHFGHFLHWTENQRAEIDKLIETNMGAIFGAGKRLPKNSKAMNFEEWRCHARRVLVDYLVGQIRARPTQEQGAAIAAEVAKTFPGVTAAEIEAATATAIERIGHKRDQLIYLTEPD